MRNPRGHRHPHHNYELCSTSAQPKDQPRRSLEQSPVHSVWSDLTVELLSPDPLPLSCNLGREHTRLTVHRTVDAVTLILGCKREPVSSPETHDSFAR